MREENPDSALLHVPRVLSGEAAEYVVTHPGRSQYRRDGGGVSACGLAALNCARIVLGLHAAGLGSAQLVQELMKRTMLEDVLRPCISWSNSTHMAVEDIYKVPIFRKSLKLVQSIYGQAGLPFFENLILKLHELTKKHSASSCVIITRPPEIIACFCIADVPTELFVIFDSHPRPEKHPHGAAFIFMNSAASTATYLADLLQFDERLLTDHTMQWQAQLLAHCSGDIFFARRTVPSGAQWAQLTLDTSLQVLSLQARVRDLESRNQELEGDNKRLNNEVTNLEDRLIELDTELDRLSASKADETTANGVRPPPLLPFPSQPPSHVSTSHVSTPHSVRPSISCDERTSHTQNRQTAPAETANLSSSTTLAVQQAFDEEHKQLERQLLRLKDTKLKVFDCGICFESFQEDYVARVMPCGHLYCRPCLKHYAVSRINEHRYPILCPTCTADKSRSETGELDDMTIQQLGLTEKQYKIYNEMQLARFSTVIHCRRCLKTVLVDIDEYREAQEIVCPLPGCSYAWCKTCSQAIEIGGPKHSCDGSSELDHLMNQRGWKRCPGCRTPAEKISGCNHMTCMSPGCNTHYCYVCGDFIIQSVVGREIESAVSKHYRKCVLFETV